MLVKGLRLKSALRSRTDYDSRHLAPAILQIRLISLIECDDQQAAALKRGIGDQRSNIRLQPRIRLAERSVVRVIIHIRQDERILRQSVVREVG